MALRFRVRATVLCGALQTKVTLFGGRLNAVFGMTARALETLLAATDALPNTGILDALAHILVGTRIEACVSAKFMKRYKPSQLGPEVWEAAQLASACSGCGAGGTLVGLADDALINSFRVLNVRCTVLDLLCPSLSAGEEQYLSRGIGGAARSSYRKVSSHVPAHKWDFGGQASSVISNTLPENHWPESWLKLDCPLVFETVPVERFLTEELKLNLVRPVLPSDSAVLPPAAEPVEACAPGDPTQVDLSDSLASQLNGVDLNDDDDDECVPESPELIGYAPVTQQSVTQAMSAMSLQDDTLNDDDDESVPSSPELIGTSAVAARQTVAQGEPHKPIQDDMLAMLLDGLNLDDDKYTQTQPTPQQPPQRTQRTHALPRRTVSALAPSQDAMLAVLLDGFSLDGDETFMVDAGAAPRAGGGNHRAQTAAGGNAPSQRKGDIAASQTFYGTQTFYGDDSDLAALVDRLTLGGQDGF
ncbi:hypothetical protein HDU90_002175 [Geranomyces variabilis]|nr:hypothetical protein HDU90_002175 [Geranomyces variabilis]